MLRDQQGNLAWNAPLSCREQGELCRSFRAQCVF
jgi:hypothetical protein